MILKKLILHNFKQHSHLEKDLSGNVIGVVGPNGSGKSNLLGALHFAFGGEQPGFKKTDLLSWGTEEGYVDLTFEQDGKSGHIRRDLTGNNAVFTYDKEAYRGITRVSEGILFHLGMDKDLLRQAVFVRQAEIDAILFEDPRVRELAFQKLCGIGDAAKIHKKLGEEVAKLSVPPNYDEQIVEGKQRHKEMYDRLQQLKGVVTAATAKKQQCSDAVVLQEQLIGFEGTRMALVHYGQNENALATNQEKLSKAFDALKHLPVDTIDIKTLDTEIASRQTSLKLAEEYERKQRAWEDAGKAILALGDPPAPLQLPYTDAQLTELRTAAEAFVKAHADALANHSLYADLHRTLQAKPLTECPICGGPVKDLNRIRQKMSEYDSTMRELNKNGAQLAFQTAIEAQDRATATHTQRTNQFNVRYEMLLNQFNQVETALKVATKIEVATLTLRNEIGVLEQRRNTALQRMVRRVQLNKEVEDCSVQLESLQKERKEMEASQQLVGISECLATNGLQGAMTHIQQQAQVVSAQLVETQKLDQQLAQLAGMIGEQEKQQNQLENTLATLEHKRASQKEYKTAIQTLTEVRDWFHYNNGPHTLATSVLNMMNQDVNNFLGQFSAPFSVLQSTEALGFKCIFHDGRKMPIEGPPDAYHLSGGEKIQLAIAFRFASYCMFANKLGLLSLDEPTVYLDDPHIGAFCTLLGKVKDVARKMNIQILIASHERAIIPFIDTLVDLSSEQ